MKPSDATSISTAIQHLLAILRDDLHELQKIKKTVDYHIQNFQPVGGIND